MPQQSAQERSETVRVRITGTGIELEREIPVTWLPALMSLLVSGPGAVEATTETRHTSPVTPAPVAAAVGGVERTTSVVEYLREKQPQTSADTILVLAAYLELYENRRPFSRDDLRRIMRAGRIPDPANFPRDVGVAVGKGYIQPFGEGFQLTNSGLDLVAHPGPLVAPRGRGGARPRRPSRSSTEDEV